MPIIEVNNISKKYNIVHQKSGSSYVTLRDVLTNFAKHPFKSAKNIMKQKLGIGIEEFWALKDINFSVKKGEILGIIGPNGAGKSTLLKILSQITPPTTGEIKMKGRVGSLLEVGTGFNPELTGQENVYLNGAILGMTKKEISDKFNDIVEFSGVEKFIDTPVKRYSSGMKVRLGFSVAAHLEPDILLVDEVLAVGDAEFQKKCLGKMDEVTKKAGRTILFVSHNMNAVNDLCDKVILINKGRIKYIGDTKIAINKYLSTQKHSLKPYKEYPIKPRLAAQVRSIKLKNQAGKKCNNFYTNERAIAEIFFEVRKPLQGDEFTICVLRNTVPIWLSSDCDFDVPSLIKRKRGIYKKQVDLPINFLKPGNYQVCPSIGTRGRQPIDNQLDNGLEFTLTLSDKNLLNTTLHPNMIGFLAILKKWKNI